jgi:chemotaxis protein MotB
MLSGIAKVFLGFTLVAALCFISCKSKAPISQRKVKDQSALLLKERDSLLKEIDKLKGSEGDAYINTLKNSLKDALTGFNTDELNIEVRNGKVYVSMSDKLLFRTGSASVEDKGKSALKTLAAVLEKNRNIDILVEGHTDNLPIKNSLYKDNWDLSTARATSIVRILSQDYKVTPVRLIACGRGEYCPIADNKTADGRTKNRRTEIILSPKLEELYKILN